MSEATAQQLFDLLKDARPKGGNRVQSIGTPQQRGPVRAALKAVRFTVELPELGGAVELSPHLGFEPVHCKVCGAVRENVREQCRKTGMRWVHCRPCPCGGAR